ncbi:hypothetical protein [Allokutzneria albata]|uniref:Alpha/beta hydrolase family protein n=1 Tax=Allokutzneria albata TaxID=211114 RepID=A0A1G9T1C4_ALLAB|nr:hypothetical protein [Allokutzneria albata]SDM41481.1 hypothetical protein SAMN04489726_1504 [Allokutzneria albata]
MIVETFGPATWHLVYDCADRETHYAGQRRHRPSLANTELVTVENAGHWRLLHEQNTITRAVEFASVRASQERAG